MKLTRTLFLLACLIFLNSNQSFAQEYSFKNYSWDEKPNLEIPENYKNLNEVILDRTEKIELTISGTVAKQFHMKHERIYINADDAIERNNKIYIPFNLDESVLLNKVRVILKSGKIILLDKKDIKEEINEETQVKYNFFAVNGLEKGAIIEKVYILEEQLEIDGTTILMQDEYPIANLNFELIVPEHLVFKTKSYNGLSEVKIDSESTHKKLILSINEKSIAALDNDEKYSNWFANLKTFRYKLDENLISGAKNLYNFKEFATNFYDRSHPELDKKQLKAIDDFCKNIPKSNDLQEQIWNVENKVKKTIAYNRYLDASENLSEVLKIKQANQMDIIKLYYAIFNNFKIENNLVFSSNRFKNTFDKDFESYENLSEILFYFPSIKKYIAPTQIEFRIPLFPIYLGNNYGLFIKEKAFAGVNMGIGEIKFIEIPGTEITHDTMDITVDFTASIENPLITNNMTYGGYSALNFQPIKDFVSADEYKKILKSVSENYTAGAEYKTLTTANDGTDYIGKNTFHLNLSFEGKDLIQKAGESYLFSIGQTIGKQMELYQESKRTLPVEIDYPHSYSRKIKILLPKGATVKNLEKFVMQYKTEIEGKTQAEFTSNYKQTDNEITIENTEYYNIINYPKESFNQYKAVINAAADFNKIVLVVNKM
jgi:hypothetical protein